MAISDVGNFGFLTPKIKTSFFSKINAQKTQTFIDFQQTGIYIIELCVTNSCTKCQANNFIFCCEMAQKPISGNDVIFWNSILFSLPYDKKDDIFLES